jgi:hypothetical protein
VVIRAFTPVSDEEQSREDMVVSRWRKWESDKGPTEVGPLRSVRG